MESGIILFLSTFSVFMSITYFQLCHLMNMVQHCKYRTDDAWCFYYHKEATISWYFHFTGQSLPEADIPTSQGFYEGDVFLDHSLDHHPGLVFLTIYSY